MAIRSSSLLLCGLLVGCIAPPRKPAEPIEASARWGTPSAVVAGGSGGPAQSLAVDSGDAVQSTAVGGSGGAAQSAAEAVNPSGSGGGAGGLVFHAHGIWSPSDADPSRWKSALDNYVPSVRPGNQTALNTARMAFASYLNVMHNRIHPLFADTFLYALDRFSASDPLSDGRLTAEIEIILNRAAGGIERMGVTKSSGNTTFDVSALQSVKRAAPFGTPPPEILSPDGKVYVHWEFHRNKEACSTFNARPFMLKARPKAAAD